MPDWAAHVRPRLSPLRLSPNRENEIVEELSQHLDDRWRELVAGGTPVPITLGAPAGHVLRDAWQDLRHATRMVRRQPTFSLTAILTLALGIGATTAMFSVVNGVVIMSPGAL